MIKRILKYLPVSGILLMSVIFAGAMPFFLSEKKMNLVWVDEFEIAGFPDSSRWSFVYGDGCPSLCGFGNNELQFYTAHRPENARIENGHLIIEAHREKMHSREYSSSRLVSRQKGDWTYGRFVARVKLPEGVGVWPAFWMLPTDWVYGDWPASGEIDIMEFVGYMPDSIFGTIHTKRFNHSIGTQVSKGLFSPTLSSDFHEYSIDWDKDKIDFFFDGYLYQTFHNRHEGSESWPFDQNFHIVLNLAVGGNWGGRMGVDTSIWPRQLIVDYVRVYQ